MHVKQKILILHHMFWIIWVMGRYIHCHCHLCFSCVSSFPAYIHSNQIMGWGEKAIEIRSVETGHLDGVFMHKRAQRLKFLCERNDKVKKKKKKLDCMPLDPLVWFVNCCFETFTKYVEKYSTCSGLDISVSGPDCITASVDKMHIHKLLTGCLLLCTYTLHSNST